VQHLGAVGWKRRPGEGETEYPFGVPVVRSLDRIELRGAVTFFVGENGSGKSTLLEAIAAAAGLPTVGSEPLDADPTLAPARALAARLRLEWVHRAHRGFFLRAEDFFGFAKYVARLRAEAERRIAELEDEYRDRSAWARALAEGPQRGSIAGLEARYGGDLDARSHGQSFLTLFSSRFVPNGLHLIDEPEAALSPQSQLALLSMLGEMVGEGAQFVIATHSPILLAYPGAQILSFDSAPPAEVAYEELEGVQLTASFLANPRRYLRHLLPAEGEGPAAAPPCPRRR
jgi:predicted ATPase